MAITLPKPERTYTRPDSVCILGKMYTIEYKDKPSDVDIFKRSSIWGQCDFWTHSIRIYDCKENEDVWHTIMHEIAHAIVFELKLKTLDPANDEAHDDLDLLMLGLVDTLTRNGWW